MKRGSLTTPALCLALAAMIAACAKPHWRKAAEHLDDVAKFADKYGTVSVSEPLVIENKGQFAIDVNRPVKEYIDAARTGVQGSSRQAIEIARDKQTATQSDLNVEELAATALKVAASSAAPGSGAVIQAAEQALSTASGAGPETDAAADSGEVEPSTPTFESKVPLDRPAKAVLSSEKFSAPLALGPLPSQLSERQALLVGVNDKVTENILKYMVNPGTGVGANKKVYLGVLQVSVQPGWHTRENHVAEVHVRPSYACESQLAKKNKLCDSDLTPWCSSLSVDRSQPLVFSAFPSVEAQTLDLRLSSRRQVAEANFWATILRASGGVVQAEQLEDYVERLERDIATRNPIPVVTAYSNGAGFGYHVRPSLQALTDPAAEEGRAGHVLQPASFPAVIMIVAEADEIVEWSNLEWSVSSRWIPTEKPCCWGQLSESKRIEAAVRLDQVHAELNAAKKLAEDLQAAGEAGIALPGKYQNQLVDLFGTTSGPTDARKQWLNSNTANELKRRYLLYESVGQGVTRYSAIPRAKDSAAARCGASSKPTPNPKPTPTATPAPAIANVAPLVGWQNAPSVFAIQGSGLSKNKKSIVKQVMIGGVPAQFQPAGTNTLVAVVPARSFDPESSRSSSVTGPQDVTVVTTEAILQAPASMRVSFNKRVKEPKYSENAVVTLKRNQNGRFTEIVLDGNTDLPPEKLLDAVKSMVEKEALADNVEVKVSSSSSVEQKSSPKP